MPHEDLLRRCPAEEVEQLRRVAAEARAQVAPWLARVAQRREEAEVRSRRLLAEAAALLRHRGAVARRLRLPEPVARPWTS